ncbi:hypothetical protein [Pedobacter sp. N23S346]|uniref:hypothetical protein n=1 Tax=Pedobacter sp. N23S346 TaxID=3402750 RepID=UPI003AC6D304
MRKNYVLLKQYGLALTLLLTTTIIIYSCKKDLGSSQLSNAELSDLRNWYESNSGKVINDRFQKMKPIWDDVFVSDHDDQIVYELNLENPDQVFQVINATVVKEKSSTNRNLIKLLIFKNKKTSKIDYGVYQSILNEGSLLNLEQLHYKQMNGLSGKVMYYNFDGSFSNGWNYASGEVTNSIQPIEQSIYLNAQLDRLSRNQQKGTSSKEKLQLAYPDECIGKITEYGVACAGVEGYMVCNVYEKGSSYFNACGGGNGKGGNNGGYQPPGGSGTPYFDCAGVKNGKAIDSPCGCIGGTTGLESCMQRDIIDSLRGYPCAQDLLRRLPNLNTDLAALIKKTFGTNANIDLRFSIDNTLKNTATDGRFDGLAGTSPSNGAVYKILLNPDVLSKSSKEYILATMYHEALHAYVAYAQSTLSDDVFAATFGSLDFNGGRTLFKEVDGHFELAANNYLNGLKDAILAFNPNYDTGRAYSLAQGGIVQLSNGAKAVNDQERDTTKPGYTGTKCP